MTQHTLKLTEDGIISPNSKDYSLTINYICASLDLSRDAFYKKVYRNIDCAVFPPKPKDPKALVDYELAVRAYRDSVLSTGATVKASVFFAKEDIIKYLNKNFSSYIRTTPLKPSKLFKGHSRKAEKMLEDYAEEDSKNISDFDALKKLEAEICDLAKECGTYDMYKKCAIHNPSFTVTDRTSAVPFVPIKRKITSEIFDSLLSQKEIAKYPSRATKLITSSGAIAFRQLKEGSSRASKTLYYMPQLSATQRLLMAPAIDGIKYM